MDVPGAESKMAVSRRARPLSSAAQYPCQHSWQSNRRSSCSNGTTGDVLLSWWSHSLVSLDNESSQIQMRRSCRVQSLTTTCVRLSAVDGSSTFTRDWGTDIPQT